MANLAKLETLSNGTKFKHVGLDKIYTVIAHLGTWVVSVDENEKMAEDYGNLEVEILN